MPVADGAMADRLEIANDLGELARMSGWLLDRAAAAGIEESLLPRLDLCANEAAENIIRHAFQPGAPHSITIELWRTTAGAELRISDDGRPFDPLSLPDPVRPASLAEARIGGLGVHLMRSMASRCAYAREGGCNVLVLEVAVLPGAAAAGE